MSRTYTITFSDLDQYEAMELMQTTKHLGTRRTVDYIDPDAEEQVLQSQQQCADDERQQERQEMARMPEDG